MANRSCPAKIFYMASQKKLIRAKFRASVFDRDGFKCRMCGHKPEGVSELDAHHITDRNLIINGGYVPENGIALCCECHIKAEQFHKDGEAYPGYTPEDLYKEISSNYIIAVEASKRL